jgi:hypothetical protein
MEKGNFSAALSWAISERSLGSRDVLWHFSPVLEFYDDD